VRAWADSLRSFGIRPAEVVALWSPNCPEWIAACLGIIAAGAVVMPVEAGITDAELARILTVGECRRAIVGGRLSERLARLAPHVQALALDEAAPAGEAVSGRLETDARLDAVAVLLFTSGTTGTPKGIPLTHRNIASNVAALAAERLARADDRVLVPLPLHHAYPLTVGVLGVLASGAALILPAGISGPQMVSALRAGGATILLGVPRLLEALLSGIEARLPARGPARLLSRSMLGLSIWCRRHGGPNFGRSLFSRLHREIGPRLRTLVCGGAHLDESVAWKLEGLGWQVLTGYGLTETSPVLTFNLPGRSRIGSEGRPIPGVELRVGEPDSGGLGEILARGPNVFQSYWRDPVQSAEAFETGGWFRTGDLGRIDSDGYLYILGRRKEIIVLPDGKKVFPENLEATYASLPVIREIGILVDGGRLRAVILPDYDAIRARGTMTLDKMLRQEIEHFSITLPSHLRLAGYAIARQPLPRTNLGKIRRHLLPGLYRTAASGVAETPAEPTEADRALLADPIGAMLWTWLERRFPDRPLRPDSSPQLDLDVDSLEWVNLTLQIQDRLGIPLSEAAIARVVTLRDLLVEAIEAGRQTPGAMISLQSAVTRVLAPPGPLLRAIGMLFYALNWAVIRLAYRLVVIGAGRLPLAGAVVLTPNHASYLDPFVLAAALPLAQLRRTYWAGWTGKLFSNAVARSFSRMARVVPIDPDRSPAISIAIATEVLRRGDALVWFPEGRRSPSGKITEFQPGVGLIIDRTRADALPIRIEGTFAAWPRTRRFPRPGRVRVTFGEPVTADRLAAGAEETAPRRVVRALREAVARTGSAGG
jgi:long-chain acyl-CoA synthetase